MTDATGKDKFVDIEKVLASKNKNLLKWMPSFVVKYLKGVIHEDELNAFILKEENAFGLDFVADVIHDFGIKIKVEGLENIDETGRYIVAANHPLGGMDGIALMHVVGGIRKDILFPANDILMNVPNVRALFVPINKHGSNSENARIIDKAFEEDNIILYFPAGLVSRRQKGVIRDLEWKKTFIRKSRDHKRDIIPTHISGLNTNWFYGLAQWRKRLGISANLEMLYLVDEMIKQRGKEINIKFGKAIPYQTFHRKKKDLEWANDVKQIVYELK